MIKAIAYVSDPVLGPQGDALGVGHQTEAIKKYAADNGLEIIAWFEDPEPHNDVLTRPGIRRLLAFDQPYERILCAQIKAVSNSLAGLRPFFEELELRGVRLDPAVSQWDLVSQLSRRRFSSLPYRPRPMRSRYRVKKPAHMYFEALVFHSG
jgi:hypothetical protein